MATLLMVMAVIPVLVGWLMDGDFTQAFYIPPSRLSMRFFQQRYRVLGLSAALYIAGVWVHLTITPASPAVVIISGLAIVGLGFAAFFAGHVVVFPAVHHDATWLSIEEAEKRLPGDTPIVGVSINGDARAFPVPWIVRPHVVQDMIGHEPVVMTFCGLSNLGKAFHGQLNGLPLKLAVVEQLENNVVLYDQGSNQLVQQIDGAITMGSQAGTSLPEYPVLSMTLKAWQSLYPTTKVFFQPMHGPLAVRITAFTQNKVAQQFKQEAPVFRTIRRFNNQLPPKAEVLGVRHGAAYKAYSLDYVRQHQVVNDMIGGLPIVVVHDPNHDIADVFERTVGGEVLTFEDASTDHTFMVRAQRTQTIWNLRGEPAGPPSATGSSASLRRFPHDSRVLWMIWYNFYPQTELVC